MLQVSILNWMHAPYAPKIENTEGPKGLRPLGAQYLASCSQQLWSFKNAFCAELASSSIIIWVFAWQSHDWKLWSYKGSMFIFWINSGIETYRFTREAVQ